MALTSISTFQSTIRVTLYKSKWNAFFVSNESWLLCTCIWRCGNYFYKLLLHIMWIGCKWVDDWMRLNWKMNDCSTVATFSSRNWSSQVRSLGRTEMWHVFFHLVSVYLAANRYLGNRQLLCDFILGEVNSLTLVRPQYKPKVYCIYIGFLSWQNELYVRDEEGLLNAWHVGGLYCWIPLFWVIQMYLTIQYTILVQYILYAEDELQ